MRMAQGEAETKEGLSSLDVGRENESTPQRLSAWACEAKASRGPSIWDPDTIFPQTFRSKRISSVGHSALPGQKLPLVVPLSLLLPGPGPCAPTLRAPLSVGATCRLEHMVQGMSPFPQT